MLHLRCLAKPELDNIALTRITYEEATQSNKKWKNATLIKDIL